MCLDFENGGVRICKSYTGFHNMQQYGRICLNRTLICPNASEFTIVDRVLNMYHIMHRARSLFKLMNTY